MRRSTWTQAAIGPGMQVYSRYSRVETISGEPVTVREALAAINQAIAEYDETTGWRLRRGERDSASFLASGARLRPGPIR